MTDIKEMWETEPNTVGSQMLDSLHYNVRNLLKDQCWDFISNWINESPGTEPRNLYSSQGPHWFLSMLNLKTTSLRDSESSPSSGQLRSSICGLHWTSAEITYNFRGEILAWSTRVSMLKRHLLFGSLSQLCHVCFCFIIKILRRAREFITQSECSF